MIPDNLIPALKDLVHELVVGNFATLEADGRAGRLTAKDLHQVFERYGRTFIEAPDEAFQIGEAYRLEGTGDEAWAVDLDLWTAEEGRSDLTLTLTVRNTAGGIVTEIDDVHAL